MYTADKTVLILGATGGIGGAIAVSLRSHGWTVKALARDTAKAAAGWRGKGQMPQWIEGDAMQRDDVIRAATGVDAIVHAVNPPGYQNWDKVVLPMIDNTIAAARCTGGARVVLPGTIYNFDPAHTPLLEENSPQNPLTRKGAIRVQLEQRLEEAAPDVPALILRAGDFLGPGARASWFAQAKVTPGKPVRRLVNPGKGTGHSWAYLPDLAETFARLMDVPEKLRSFERVQFEGIWDADGSRLGEAIRRIIGRNVPEWRFPWWLTRALSAFGGFPREAAEISHYWKHPVRLDNTRLIKLLGSEPHTQIDDALRVTLAAMGCFDSGYPSFREQATWSIGCEPGSRVFPRHLSTEVTIPEVPSKAS